MHKSEIKAKVKQTHRAAKRSFKAYIKKGEQAKLHRFRTSVKKLRAIAGLVAQTAQLPHLTHTLRPLKKTFKLTGAIRDSYLHLELGKKFKARPGYLTAESSMLKKASAKLDKQSRRHVKRLKKGKEQLMKALVPVSNIELNWHYEQELKAIEVQLKNPGSDDHLHATRKRLKVLLYDLPLVRKIITLPVNEAYLEQVQTAIGDWHDNLLAADNFPALKRKTARLRGHIQSLAVHFYERATTPVEIPLQQID